MEMDGGMSEKRVRNSYLIQNKDGMWVIFLRQLLYPFQVFQVFAGQILKRPFQLGISLTKRSILLLLSCQPYAQKVYGSPQIRLSLRLPLIRKRHHRVVVPAGLQRFMLD